MINPPWWKTSFVFFIILYFKRGICHSMSDQKQNVKFPSAGVETRKSRPHPDAEPARNNSRFHVGLNLCTTVLTFNAKPIYSSLYFDSKSIYDSTVPISLHIFWLLPSKFCFFSSLSHVQVEKKANVSHETFLFFKIRYLRKSQQAQKSLLGLLSSLLFRIKQISENKHISPTSSSHIKIPSKLQK